jgi:hypothetical protein
MRPQKCPKLQEKAHRTRHAACKKVRTTAHSTLSSREVCRESQTQVSEDPANRVRRNAIFDEVLGRHAPPEQVQYDRFCAVELCGGHCTTCCHYCYCGGEGWDVRGMCMTLEIVALDVVLPFTLADGERVISFEGRG